MRWALMLPFLLIGCATISPEEPVGGTVHVLVVGGTVVEDGPEPEQQAVCDIAPPPFSANADQRKIWWIDNDWSNLDVDSPILVIRVDRTDKVADDGCWTPSLHGLSTFDTIKWQRGDAAAQLAVQSQPEHVIVGGEDMGPGSVFSWVIDESCRCDPYYDTRGDYTYQGTLQVQYLGAWTRANVDEVHSYDDLPPLEVPYWNGY